ADVTALAGADYGAEVGTLTFTPGLTSRTVVVAVNGDTADERNETFSVSLGPALNATIASGVGLGTIVDNDPAPPGSPSVSIASRTVTEGNTGTVNAVFMVKLSVASANTVLVDYATADGTALSGA